MDSLRPGTAQPPHVHELLPRLQSLFPSARIKCRLIDRIAFASDAGFYHLIPRVIVQPIAIDEVARLFLICRELHIPLTFRAGGSSLSGQAITDGVLVDLSQHWRTASPARDGSTITVQPGITGSMVNYQLKPYGTKIGPDPASINTAMMGGILSNNSSGMCCGVRWNAYHTLRSIHFLLPDGNEYNTANTADYERFSRFSAALFQALAGWRDGIRDNKPLYDRIRRKYRTKNTVGYSLNAFVDFDHPLDIFAHLLIGAEGTLGFIAGAVLQTIPDHPCKATALLLFADMDTACAAIPAIRDAGAEMIELMDRASLDTAPDLLPTSTIPSSASALLVEFQAPTAENIQQLLAAFNNLTLSGRLPGGDFTTDPAARDHYWKIRKGLFPSIGAVRAKGTTVILEDIAFPVDRLAPALAELRVLFSKHGYDNAIIFGHAKDGNIHFCITQSFHTPDQVDRYRRFMDDVVELVIGKYDGALKAEHGTGRNMAPFVEAEWGGDAYAIMRELKSIVDPQNILNPGVIINDDKLAHIKDLKALPEVEPEVDKCIECGYCEHKCPSRDLTLTPRRRIVVRRALATLRGKQRDTLLKEYRYDGLDTCSTDGLCATECPVDIDTGQLVRRLRKESHSRFANSIAATIARHFAATETLVKLALRSGIVQLIPSFRHLIPRRSHPIKLHPTHSANAAATQFLYFATCINRTMGKPQLPAVAEKAGIGLLIPPGLHGRCCGQPFSSKGFDAAARLTRNRTIAWLWQHSDAGRLPIVLDLSSCTHTLQDCRPYLDEVNKERFDKLTILDSVDFLHDHVLPKLTIRNKKSSIVLHPACSLIKMKNAHKLTAIAKQCAHHVFIPPSAGCCGMAGDRGFLFPELIHAAINPESTEIAAANAAANAASDAPFAGFYSTSLTCEMALSAVTQKNYQSILQLVADCL